MIDTHAHIKNPLVPIKSGHPPLKKGEITWDYNLEKLDWVVLSASSLQDSKDNLELAKINNKLLPCIGIHPQELNDKVEDLEKLMNDKVVAVGECGLEFLDGVDKEKQIELFKKQIELAIKFGKPLIVHSRKANDEILAILKNYSARGVVHCYTGGIKRINKFLELGDWYLGIDGNLTYEVGLSEVVKNIPKNRLILETDTPYLAPIPHRGETNKPEWVEFTYKKVAEIWEMSFEEVEKIIDENAKKLFQII
jgi:TatD DNase family protein